MPPRAAQDEKGAAALRKESGRQCASPLRSGARNSTVNQLAATRIIVNVHPLLSKRYTLHHRRAAHIEEINAPGRDSTRL